MKKTIALVVVALAALGCSSDKKKTETAPQPRMEDSSAKPANTADATKPAAKDEPIAINIKKGEKRPPEAAFKGDPPAGYVCFDFQRVDLKDIALPLFSKQAGVTIEYTGKLPRTLTLRIDPPAAWRDALGIICKQTTTHVVKSSIAGRLELREGFADPSDFLASWNPKTGGGDVNTTVTDGAGGSTATPTNPGTQPDNGQGGSVDTSDYQQPKQPGVDTIERLRTGTTMTNSGAGGK
jgi:hypothetical protein